MSRIINPVLAGSLILVIVVWLFWPMIEDQLSLYTSRTNGLYLGLSMIALAGAVAFRK